MKFNLEIAVAALVLGLKATMALYNLTNKQIKKNFMSLARKNGFNKLLSDIVKKWIQNHGEDFCIRYFALTPKLVEILLTPDSKSLFDLPPECTDPDELPKRRATPENTDALTGEKKPRRTKKARLSPEQLVKFYEMSATLSPSQLSEIFGVSTYIAKTLLEKRGNTEIPAMIQPAATPYIAPNSYSTPVTYPVPSAFVAPNSGSGYTEDQKREAVKLYHQNRNFSQTANQLGIHDIFAVVKWVKEAEETR